MCLQPLDQYIFTLTCFSLRLRQLWGKQAAALCDDVPRISTLLFMCSLHLQCTHIHSCTNQRPSLWQTWLRMTECIQAPTQEFFFFFCTASEVFEFSCILSHTSQFKGDFTTTRLPRRHLRLQLTVYTHLQLPLTPMWDQLSVK